MLDEEVFDCLTLACNFHTLNCFPSLNLLENRSAPQGELINAFKPMEILIAFFRYREFP